MSDTISSEDEALASRLEELKAALEQEEFEKVVTLCETQAGGLLKDPALTTAKSANTSDEGNNDDTSITTLATVYESYAKALLHVDQHQKVMDLAAPSKECRVVLEPLQAYAMYRLEQYDRAIQTVDKLLKTSKDANTTTTTILNHIRAQSLFRITDTSGALSSFEAMIEQASKAEGSKNDGNEDLLLEAYTNAMAVLTANATPYNDCQFEQSPLVKHSLDFVVSENHDVADYPCDLAFNLATLQLLQTDTAAKRQDALKLLQQAQRNCTEVLTSDGVPAKDIQLEVLPMRLNGHWGRVFWGEEAPSTATIKSSSKNGITSTNSVLEQVNPVLLQESTSQKAIDKAIQQLESLLNEGATSSSTKAKLSPLQKRLVRYNIAVLQLRSKRWEECRKILDALSQSLSLSSSSKKKNKKKAYTAQQQQQGGDAWLIPAPSDTDALWWQVRIEVLQAYSYYQSDDEDNDAQPLKEAIQKLETRQEKIMAMLSSGDAGDHQKMIEHTLLYLALHMKELAGSFSTEEQFQWLQQQCKPYPAVTASLAKQYQDRNQQDKARDILLALDKESNGGGGGGGNSNHIIAEMAMAQENYQEAVALYEQALKTDPGNHSLRARLVEALSHMDPNRALEEWKGVQAEGGVDDDDEEEDVDDAETLEMMELPRIKTQSHHPSSSLNGMESTTGAGQSAAANKKSKESVLRRRAMQRAAHLEKLQQKGLYNPSRPTQPDPERWIPKHERQRRRRRGGNQSKASQGGVSAKDAAKLDVAARASGAVDATSSGGRSTAHLNVAGGQRKGGRRR